MSDNNQAQQENVYEKDYSETSFWEKITNFAKKAGKELIEKALQLYYAAKDPQTPTWAKGTIYAALGYFISPIDVIPDVMPLVGFTDDLGVLVAAIAAVSAYITDEVRQKATDKLKEWFS